MRNKQELTNLLIELLPENKPDYKIALHSWWYNTRENGGMRLTSTGFVIFKKLDFEYWDFVLPEGFARKNKRVILGLDRKLDWPYYYGRHRISFFSSRDAMMVNLTGDIERWLSNNFSS